jgi:hypothetical protein
MNWKGIFLGEPLMWASRPKAVSQALTDVGVILRAGTLSLGLLVMPCTGTAAQAGEASNPSMASRWAFTAGALFNHSDAEVASTLKNSGAGGRVDLSTLGVDENYTSPFLAARYRLNERWRFDLSYQRLDVDGQRAATYDVEFGSMTIPTGWDVSSELSLDMYSASAGYAFYRTPDIEFGAALGVHVLDASASIRGSLSAVNTALVRSQGIGIVVPAPTVGLYGTYAINNRLAIEGAAQFIAGSYADYSGHLLIASAALNYWVLPNAALTVGYKYLDAKVTYDSQRRRDVYDVGFGGPFAALSVGF